MDMPLAFKAMNTDFLIDGLPEVAANSLQELVRQAESAFSRFAPDSEISRINQSTGEWTSVSPLTYDLLRDAVNAFQATEGLFNPFLGREVAALGYDRSFETLPAAPHLAFGKHETAVRSILLGTVAATEFSLQQPPLEMDSHKQQVRLSQFAAIDVGGIAKGWTAQRAADGLMAKGIRNGLVDAGGDVVVWGREPAQGVWGIGVADPLGSGEDIAEFWVEGLTAIATSSVVKRRWQNSGQDPAHHILDPRTGVSAASDLLQATVVARDLSIAEQYAKCLLVLGSAAGVPWLAQRRPDLAFVVVRVDGTIMHSDNLKVYAQEWKVSPRVKQA